MQQRPVTGEVIGIRGDVGVHPAAAFPRQLSGGIITPRRDVAGEFAAAQLAAGVVVLVVELLRRRAGRRQMGHAGLVVRLVVQVRRLRAVGLRLAGRDVQEAVAIGPGRPLGQRVADHGDAAAVVVTVRRPPAAGEDQGLAPPGRVPGPRQPLAVGAVQPRDLVRLDRRPRQAIAATCQPPPEHEFLWVIKEHLHLSSHYTGGSKPLPILIGVTRTFRQTTNKLTHFR